MELRTLLSEFLDQATNVRTDAARINPVVVMEVREREGSEEGLHPTQLVVEDGSPANCVVASRREAVFYAISVAAQS